MQNNQENALEARDISFRYDKKSPWILEGYNLKLSVRERTALVGPSGCGKSTLSKLLSGYERPEKGEILWKGEPLPKTGYCPVQMIGQHPEQAVNPRWKMEKILRECWDPEEELLEKMGIEKEWMKRWPIELSGGELQRFCIGRALGPKTEFLICDEISTMLDVITQAQIWQVLLEEAEKRKMGMLVITHNRSLAERVCNRIVEF
ncbi:MAG: ATP-binding cassette domain-containing protein [Lachnospiraceae bacterium]|nr:ATP-binding cassette domain-containing protein [Lachnospiraceae bacterium]